MIAFFNRLLLPTESLAPFSDSAPSREKLFWRECQDRPHCSEKQGRANAASGNVGAPNSSIRGNTRVMGILERLGKGEGNPEALGGLIRAGTANPGPSPTALLVGVRGACPTLS